MDPQKISCKKCKAEKNSNEFKMFRGKMTLNCNECLKKMAEKKKLYKQKKAEKEVQEVDVPKVEEKPVETPKVDPIVEKLFKPKKEKKSKK
jgi:late competence protein required for DNA uptake (superfamily II DNA/RNA helicase)